MIDKIKSFYSKNKQLVWLLGGVTLFVLLTSSKKKTTTSKSSTGGTGPIATTPVEFPIKYGDSGKGVKAVQRWCNDKKKSYNLSFASLVIDGKFGPKTLNALVTVWKTMYGSAAEISEVTERIYVEEGMLLYEDYF